MTRAAVVGSGPNGLAAAIRLARAGVEVTLYEMDQRIGGGLRSDTIDGLVHDRCSAVHAVGVGSPFFRWLDESYDLGRRGLRFVAAPIDCVHPLDDGTAGVLYRSVEATAVDNGSHRWQTLFAPLVDDFDRIASEVLGPVIHRPRHLGGLARFGFRSMAPATTVAAGLETERAGALWMGIAAHAFGRLDRPLSAAVGLMIAAAGHANGWVVAEGGSQRMADVLARILVEAGGRIETGVKVTKLSDVEPSDLHLFDLAPAAVAVILGDRLPAPVARAYRRYRYGPGAFKVDFVVEGGIPWTSRPAANAVTVHLGGRAAEVAEAERATAQGVMPDRPFVLVAQQYLADLTRITDEAGPGLVPVWSYAHVPNGYTGDATEAIVARIERFAPGFRDRVVSVMVRSTTELSVDNPNYVGGDIVGGASTPAQLLFRPRRSLNPCFTGVDGMYLCSASTSPGAGTHGMSGVNAADRALRDRSQWDRSGRRR